MLQYKYVEILQYVVLGCVQTAGKAKDLFLKLKTDCLHFNLSAQSPEEMLELYISANHEYVMFHTYHIRVSILAQCMS